MSDTTLLDELSAIKDVEDTVVGNKVANFAYDDYAYEHNDANGVDTYNVNNHQNIPNGTASIMKVNSTILTKGWRAQASAITRMAMNHFLGRCSYNLNKLNDLFSLFLTKLMAYMEQPNGIATLNSEGKVTALNNVANTGDSNSPVKDGVTKFTTGGAFSLIADFADMFIEGESHTYTLNHIYWYEGTFYKCTSTVTLSAWDSSYFSACKPISQRGYTLTVDHQVSIAGSGNDAYLSYAFGSVPIHLLKNNDNSSVPIGMPTFGSGSHFTGYLIKSGSVTYIDAVSASNRVIFFTLGAGETAIFIRNPNNSILVASS